MKRLRINIETSENSQSCTILKPEEHIIAYIEHREILRDFPPLACDELLEKVMSNYIIVKKILANLSWQEQILSKSVCRTWRDAVLSLQREQFGPCDFVCTLVSNTNKNVFVKSDNFSMEPLAVFVFVEDSFRSNYSCKNISPSPCSPNCTHSHCLLDVIYNSVCFPSGSNFLFMQCSYLVYIPRPQSKTYKVTVKEPMHDAIQLLAGLYLPKIPNVELHFLSVKSSTDHTDFRNEVNRISESRYFKAILVFATNRYVNESNENWILEDISILDYFIAVQKTVPYALGGCYVDNTLHDPNDLPLLIHTINEGREFDNENEISIAMFTIAKDTVEDITMKTCFEAYSLVIEDSNLSKVGIQRTVNEFSEKVPRFEYSMALKFSAVERKKHDDAEDGAFRAAFPNTPIAGCYGMYYEFGLNHPPGPQNDLPLYTSSTIFVYFGWGKIAGT